MFNTVAYRSPQSPQQKFVPLSKEEGEYVKKKLISFVVASQPVVEAQKKMIEAYQKIEASKQKIEASKQKIEEADQTIAEAQRRQKVTRANLFFRIFYGGKQAFPEGQTDYLFSLADESISFDKTKRCFKFNSMKGIVKYLKAVDRPLPVPKQCDLRVFNAEISDVDLSDLAECLEASPLRIIVALNSGISSEAKTRLKTAELARNGGLKIQYLP